jgi:hypothetical protein
MDTTDTDNDKEQNNKYGDDIMGYDKPTRYNIIDKNMEHMYDKFHILEAEHIRASIELFQLADIVGYNNGIWPDGYNTSVGAQSYVDNVNRLFDFINKGGANSFNVSTHKSSDLTLILKGSWEAMTLYKKKLNKKFKRSVRMIFYNLVDDINKHEYKSSPLVNLFSRFNEDKFTRKDSSKMVNDSVKPNTRTLIISAVYGVCMYTTDYMDLEKKFFDYIDIFDNGPMNLYANYLCVYFAYMAMLKIPIKIWAHLCHRNVNDHIKHNKFENVVAENAKEHIQVLMSSYAEKAEGIMVEYLKSRFIVDKKNLEKTKKGKVKGIGFLLETLTIRNEKSRMNPVFRSQYYANLFDNEEYTGQYAMIAVIMAYDALLDCNGSWEKLMMYTSLSIGDSNLVGSIAGLLFGAFYGYSDAPRHLIKDMEFYEELNDISDILVNKF